MVWYIHMRQSGWNTLKGKGKGKNIKEKISEAILIQSY